MLNSYDVLTMEFSDGPCPAEGPKPIDARRFFLRATMGRGDIYDASIPGAEGWYGALTLHQTGTRNEILLGVDLDQLCTAGRDEFNARCDLILRNHRICEVITKGSAPRLADCLAPTE